ncbi:Trypsin-like cysteine/serine peptidase domain-containing protein [Strongyloides ratti]|uniref:Trypsin-like cysteine/serine peptidase domain-containing protein n=1 Tax=Strongyloides ratti TaxID=34506 RepID=A0A090LCT4_STRRB|nr:Trypsin-like cysteine/serine peptidase domain-containing protein [Strongyloides ratti]CEF65305.1 Trypsin-like cysteine/serine peptidase domain-containing protein [Strongyloides ratti]
MVNFLECKNLLKLSSTNLRNDQNDFKKNECSKDSFNNFYSKFINKSLENQFEKGEFNVEIWTKSFMDESYLCPGVLVSNKHVLTTMLCVGNIDLLDNFKTSKKFKYHPNGNIFINFNMVKKNEDSHIYQRGYIDNDIFQFRRQIKNIILPYKKNHFEYENFKIFVLLELRDYVPSGIQYVCLPKPKNNNLLFENKFLLNKSNEHYFIYGAGDKYFREGKILWKRYKPKKRKKITFYNFLSNIECTYSIGYNSTTDDNLCLMVSQEDISEDDIGSGCYRTYTENDNKNNFITELFGMIVSVSSFDPLNEYPEQNIVVIKKISREDKLFKNIILN